MGEHSSEDELLGWCPRRVKGTSKRSGGGLKRALEMVLELIYAETI